MDFGDILNQWNAQENKKTVKQSGPQVSHKKANAPTKEEKEAAKQGYTYEDMMAAENKRTANPMDVWLNRYGTVDKDKVADEAAENQKLQSREYLKELKPEARIDLHGLTRDEAWQKLTTFVADCKRRELRKILIIHGKGNHTTGSDPVLGPMVRTFIEQSPLLGTSGHPDKSWGGNGATWVIIK
jgi:Uncharacterized protein conserved in bacteria